MAAPDSVVVVLEISVTLEEKSATVDFCHFVTLPVSPLRLRPAGVLPLHMVCEDDTVPPTEVALTVKVAL